MPDLSLQLMKEGYLGPASQILIKAHTSYHDLCPNETKRLIMPRSMENMKLSLM